MIAMGIYGEPSIHGLIYRDENPSNIGIIWDDIREHGDELLTTHEGFQLVMGVPQARWMVYSGTSQSEMDDEMGVPLISGNHQMGISMDKFTVGH